MAVRVLLELGPVVSGSPRAGDGFLGSGQLRQIRDLGTSRLSDGVLVVRVCRVGVVGLGSSAPASFSTEVNLGADSFGK